MKTALICPVWLDNEDYYNKTVKFLDYYTQPKVMDVLGISLNDIWLIDNASGIDTYGELLCRYGINGKRYEKHYQRTAHLEYPYCWRCLYFARELFQEHDYDKVIHLNNDTYIISKKMMKDITGLTNKDWVSPWCDKHGFIECDLQIIGKYNELYWKMTGKPYLSYNGAHMEKIIKAETNGEWVGDRHSENELLAQQPEWDFSCQVRLTTEIKFND